MGDLTFTKRLSKHFVCDKRRWGRSCGPGLSVHPVLLTLISHQVFSKVVIHKSTPPQIRQRILYISKREGLVDGFLGKLTFKKRLLEPCEMNADREDRADQGLPCTP